MWSNQGAGYGEQAGYGGDQGGGYLNSPGGFGSPGQASQERKARQRAQNVMPVTVAQVLAAEQQDDKFLADGVELHQVTIVGLVRSVKESNTRLDYEVDDLTGPFLEVRQFVDNDDATPDEEKTTAMRENTYVRIFGHVRSFGGKRSLVAFRMLPLLDMDELTTHMLEVVHSHLVLTKPVPNSVVGGGQPSMMDTSATPGGEYSGAQGDNSGLNPVQQQVSLVIKSCSDEQGVSVSLICQKLRSIPQKAIREAIEFLSGEGHIYSTIDDDHFRSTDS